MILANITFVVDSHNETRFTDCVTTTLLPSLKNEGFKGIKFSMVLDDADINEPHSYAVQFLADRQSVAEKWVETAKKTILNDLLVEFSCDGFAWFPTYLAVMLEVPDGCEE